MKELGENVVSLQDGRLLAANPRLPHIHLPTLFEIEIINVSLEDFGLCSSVRFSHLGHYLSFIISIFFWHKINFSLVLSSLIILVTISILSFPSF